MADANIVQSMDLKVFDGWRCRCRLDGAAVHFNFDNGARTVEQTTDGDGLLPDSGILVAVQYTTVRVTVTRSGYRPVAVRGSITWTPEGQGVLGIEAIHLGAR